MQTNYWRVINLLRQWRKLAKKDPGETMSVEDHKAFAKWVKTQDF